MFFRKRNKYTRSAHGYRPITLLPISGKQLEKIIKIRKISVLEIKNILRQINMDLQKVVRSMLIAFSRLKQLVKNLLNINKCVEMISVDVEGVFDSVS